MLHKVPNLKEKKDANDAEVNSKDFSWEKERKTMMNYKTWQRLKQFNSSIQVAKEKWLLL